MLPPNGSRPSLRTSYLGLLKARGMGELGANSSEERQRSRARRYTRALAKKFLE